MASPRKLNLKVFAAGEIPYPVLHTFTRADGEAIDLTAYTASVYIEGPEETSVGNGDISIIDAPGGRVRYTWDPEDMQEPGKYQMLIWVDDGTNRFASDLIVYEVYDGPGPTPS